MKFMIEFGQETLMDAIVKIAQQAISMAFIHKLAIWTKLIMDVSKYKSRVQWIWLHFLDRNYA